MTLCELFFYDILQRTNVNVEVTAGVERQDGRAIQKQPRHDWAQRAHHQEGQILAELCTRSQGSVYFFIQIYFLVYGSLVMRSRQ